MLKVKVYDKTAKEVGNMELNSDIFERDYNEALIHQVIVAQLANKRQGTKSTLTRSEVRGGGRKPWRQKGTGHARQGSIRAPQWIKGGVAFAPKPRDFSQKVNKTMRREAIKSALSKKLADNEVVVINELALDAAKTKEMASILNNFDLNKRTLIVISGTDDKIMRSARNIANVTTIDAALINVYDIVVNAKCLFTKDAIRSVEEALHD